MKTPGLCSLSGWAPARSAWQEGAVARPLGSPSPQPFPILLPWGSGSLSCSAPAPPRLLPAEASGQGTAPSSSLSKGAPETVPARKSGGLGIRWVFPSALAWGSVYVCLVHSGGASGY